MLKEYLSTLANKFREVLGTTEPINAQDFADKIQYVYEVGYGNGSNYGYEQGKAEGVTEGKPLGKIELLQDSKYMNAKVSGTAIAVNDVSPIEHSVGCRVASKNLLNVKNRTVITYDGSGLNFVENAIYLDMARNGVYSYTKTTYDISNPQQLKFKTYTNGFGLNFSFKVKPNETYTLNCSNFDKAQHRMGVGYFTKDCVLIKDFPIGERPNLTAPVTFTTPANCYWMLVIVAACADTTGKELTFENVQLELGTTATAYTPYVEELDGIEVSRYGKNLCSNVYADYADTNYKSLYIANEPLTMSFTDKDTSVDISGCYIGFAVNPNNASEGFRWVIDNGTVKSANLNDAAQNGKRCPYVFVYPNDENTFNKLMQRFYIQVELGNTSTEFEPYKLLQKITANADGTVDGITSISPNMTLLTNNNNVVINANYLRDIDTYIDNLITNVALTGGE